MSATQGSSKIDLRFNARIVKEKNSGWACVPAPKSGEYFGTRKPVKVGGVVDGIAFNATLLPMGDGQHMVPLKAALREALGKDVGDEVSVHLVERNPGRLAAGP